MGLSDRIRARSDATIRAVLAAHGLRARVVHVPVGLAMALARPGRALSPYAIDQIAHGVVLDITKATAQGWRPVRYTDQASDGTATAAVWPGGDESSQQENARPERAPGCREGE